MGMLHASSKPQKIQCWEKKFYLDMFFIFKKMKKYPKELKTAKNVKCKFGVTSIFNKIGVIKTSICIVAIAMERME